MLCSTGVDSFSAESQEIHQRLCLVPYHFYNKIHKMGTPDRFSHKLPGTGHIQLKLCKVTTEVLL